MFTLYIEIAFKINMSRSSISDINIKTIYTTLHFKSFSQPIETSTKTHKKGCGGVKYAVKMKSNQNLKKSLVNVGTRNYLSSYQTWVDDCPP